MSKKVVIFVLAAAVIFAVSYYYFTSKASSTTVVATDEDTQLINNVIEIERNLIAAESHSISFDEYKNRISPFIHMYYQDSYFGELERGYNRDGGFLAESTKSPIYQYISKIYSSNDSVKYIFVKNPVEGTTSQIAKLYIFKKENDQWKIFSANNYILTISRNEPKRIIEKFTNYNGAPIEYEYIKILE